MLKPYKPMLANDLNEEKLRFPCYVQPKIDGVRGNNIDGKMFARSMKPFANKAVMSYYSDRMFTGMDGELTAGSNPTAQNLCSLSTTATSTIEGDFGTHWWVFDAIKTYEPDLRPYSERYIALIEWVQTLNSKGYENIHIIPNYLCLDLEQFYALENKFLDEGYEGAIVRDIDGLHKQGRSTVREMGLLRKKRFIDAECLVESIYEAQENQNEEFINELGHTTRTSHQENKVGNGMLGSIKGRLLADLLDPTTGALLVAAGEPIIVGPGKLPHSQRVELWDHPEYIVGKIIKFKTFPKGVKDKPRFPTFESFRDAVDMS